MKYLVQQVVHRQAAGQAAPIGEQSHRAFDPRRCGALCGPVGQSLPPGACAARQIFQVVIGETEQRRFQTLRQRQIVERRRQHGQQALQIVDFKGFEQAAAPIAEIGNAGLTERILEYAQIAPVGIQQQDVAKAGGAWLRRVDLQNADNFLNAPRHPGRLGRPRMRRGWRRRGQRIAESDALIILPHGGKAA
jgi:hypothetical protein